MKFTIVILFLKLGISIPCSGQSNQQAVQDTINHFKAALQAEKYEEAVLYADSATISYYDSLVPIILHADSLQLSSMSLLDRLIILNFRHLDQASEINSFNGKQLLGFAMLHKMVSHKNIMGDTINQITSNDSISIVITTNKLTGDTVNIQLVKEKNEWKIDFLREMQMATAVIDARFKASNKTENDFIIVLLENISRKKTDPQIWHRKL